MKLTGYLTIFVVFFLQCQGEKQQREAEGSDSDFNPDELVVKSSSFEKARGQLLYLPLYSNIPYSEKTGDYDLSGFLTIHNTDLKQNLVVTQILYFNTNGKLMKNFLGKSRLTLLPLQSKSFLIPEKDKSGTGANFLVEWKTDTAINIPLIETIMLSLKSGQGVSFLSTGKVIEQVD